MSQFWSQRCDTFEYKSQSAVHGGLPVLICLECISRTILNASTISFYSIFVPYLHVDNKFHRQMFGIIIFKNCISIDEIEHHKHTKNPNIHKFISKHWMMIVLSVHILTGKKKGHDHHQRWWWRRLVVQIPDNEWRIPIHDHKNKPFYFISIYVSVFFLFSEFQGLFHRLCSSSEKIK